MWIICLVMLLSSAKGPKPDQSDDDPQTQLTRCGGFSWTP